MQHWVKKLPWQRLVYLPDLPTAFAKPIVYQVSQKDAL